LEKYVTTNKKNNADNGRRRHAKSALTKEGDVDNLSDEEEVKRVRREKIKELLSFSKRKKRIIEYTLEKIIYVLRYSQI
jgi:hypothetical protein